MIHQIARLPHVKTVQLDKPQNLVVVYYRNGSRVEYLHPSDEINAKLLISAIRAKSFK